MDMLPLPRPSRALSVSFALLVLVRLGGGAAGQEANRTATKFYPDFSDTADALLRNAASHVRDKQWAEAIEIYQRVVQQYGDKVARLPREDEADEVSGESALYVDLRQFCQRRLAALPPEARAIYRERVDPQAERWYRQGVELRDRGLLRRVVEQAFCSSWGDDALEMLGDLAFEDGRFEEALATFRRVVPDHPSERPGLVHPDPSVELARVAAKKVLCRAALGDLAAARAELDVFAKTYPNASGSLAGRVGAYATILSDALKTDRLGPPSQPDGRWPTFAGAPTRTKIVNGRIDVGSLQWRVALPEFEPSKGIHVFGGFRRGFGPSQVTIAPDRKLCYHPIVLGDQVVICDENKISAYNLNDRPEGPLGSRSGKISPIWEAPPDGQDGSGPRAVQPNLTIPRYTLTAFGDRIYARLGSAGAPMILGMGMGVPRAPSQSKIIAVDRTTEGKVLWAQSATDVTLPKRPAETVRNIGFEGTPLADARSVYVAMTERREQTATYVACLNADDGSTRWVRYLGAASTDAENMPGFGMGMGGFTWSNDFGHRLLTLDGPTIYYQTNLGAVVALDAETGGIRWVATYPRLDRIDGGPAHDRDLNPAIVHDGLVIVAPDDAASLYAFDAEGGRLVWKSDPVPADVKLAHLLGVAKGRVIATGDRVLLYDVKTGKLLHSWPDGGHVYEGFGRGLLADDRIYWPTRNEIHILDQETGLRTDPPIKLQEAFNTTGGNLAVGDGYLIVAQPDALVVFCQNSRLIQRYREEIARAPDHAANYFRLAQAAEATGEDELALSSLAMALNRARPSETIDGVALTDSVRDHQYRLLMRLGSKGNGAKEWGRAEERFESAARIARSDRERLAARLLLAEVQLRRGARGEAVATLQSLLADNRLRHLSVAADDGHRTIRADLLIADRLGAILRDHGRALYEAYDRQARLLLERGRAERDPRLLEEIDRGYPSAEVLPESLLALGVLDEALQRPIEAAHAYKRLVRAAPGEAMKARALLGLARAYESQRLWLPARDTYNEAISRFGNVHLDEFSSGVRLASFVSERLARPPFDRINGGRAQPNLPIPLVRRWARPLPRAERPLTPSGTAPSTEATRIFLAQGTALLAVDAATGETVWGADLGGVPLWVGYLADRMVAATESRVLGLGFQKGTVEWVYEHAATPAAPEGANPFAKADAGPALSANTTSSGFQGFRIVGGRVFFLRGERELVALDGDTGLVEWSYAHPAGTLNPNLLVGPNTTVLQVRKPNLLRVLDTATGRRKLETRLSADEDWERAPLAVDDDHVAVVADKRTVALLDLRQGSNCWIFRESSALPKNGPPQLFGGAEELLVVHDGTELIRLDPRTGERRWSRPLGAENLSERRDAMTLDEKRFYWASDRTLCAASLADGALAWSRTLSGPEAGWSVALTERCVVANPVLASPGDGESESLPIVFHRRDTGALVQRLVFPVSASEVVVRLTPRGVFVTSLGSREPSAPSRGGIWALGERREAESTSTPR